MKSTFEYHKISLRTCASVELISELEYCQIGMTVIVMGDVNAVCALGCTHRRHMLAARAPNERSLLTRGLPFPPTKTIGDVYSDDLVILTVLQCSDVHAASLSIEVWRAPTLCTPSNAHECGQVWQYTDGRVLGGHVDGVAGPFGFSSRTTCLAHAHHDAGGCHTGKWDIPPTPPR